MKKYPTYKQTKFEWLGQIPVGFDVISLKHLVEIKITDGPHETPVAVQEGIPFISAEAIQNYTINFDSKWGYITKEDHLKYSKKCKPKNGDIFIVKSGATTGKVAYVKTNIEFNIWSPLALVRANEKIVYSRYLFYFIISPFFQEQVQFSWSFGTQQNIGMGVIQNLKIVTPSLPEQQSIVCFLDYKTGQIDSFIANRQKQIELLKEQKAGIINKAVTKGINPDAKMKASGIEWIGEIPESWYVVKLKYVAKLQSGETITADDIKEVGNYPVFGGNGLRGYTANYTNDGNFILIGRQGALCGNINHATGKFWASEHAVVTYLRRPTNILWLGELLRAMNLNQYSQAAAQPGLSVDRIKNLFIPCPNYQEQNEIELYIKTETATIDTLIAKYQKQIDLMQEYRTSLISQAVTGKIDVREWQPKKKGEA